MDVNWSLNFALWVFEGSVAAATSTLFHFSSALRITVDRPRYSRKDGTYHQHWWPLSTLLHQSATDVNARTKHSTLCKRPEIWNTGAVSIIASHTDVCISVGLPEKYPKYLLLLTCRTWKVPTACTKTPSTSKLEEKRRKTPNLRSWRSKKYPVHLSTLASKLMHGNLTQSPAISNITSRWICRATPFSSAIPKAGRV